MITFAGTKLLQPPAEVTDWIEANISLADLPVFQSLTWPGSARLLWPWDHFPGQDTRRKVRINSLFWPTGASRFGVFFGLADDAMLTNIRRQITGNTARPLVLSDGRGTINNITYSITTNLHLLPPIPLGQLANVPAGLERAWLLPLCDHRFFWNENAVSIDVTDASTWAGLFTSIGTALGASITHETIDADYLSPSKTLKSHYQYLPLLLDAACANTGLRLVRKLDGTLLAQTAAQAQTSHDTQRTRWSKVAGGLIATTDPFPRAAASVVVTFPKVVAGVVTTDRHAVATSTGGGQPSTAKLYHDTAAATFDAAEDVAPTNATELQALAAQITADYYAWRQGRQASVFTGIVPYIPEGLSDAIEWTVTADRCTTRVYPRPFNDLNDRLNHRDAEGGEEIDYPPSNGWVLTVRKDSGFPTIVPAEIVEGGAGIDVLDMGNKTARLETALDATEPPVGGQVRVYRYDCTGGSLWEYESLVSLIKTVMGVQLVQGPFQAVREVACCDDTCKDPDEEIAPKWYCLQEPFELDTIEGDCDACPGGSYEWYYFELSGITSGDLDTDGNCTTFNRVIRVRLELSGTFENTSLCRYIEPGPDPRGANFLTQLNIERNLATGTTYVSVVMQGIRAFYYFQGSWDCVSPLTLPRNSGPIAHCNNLPATITVYPVTGAPLPHEGEPYDPPPKACWLLTAEELAVKLALGYVQISGPHETKAECTTACEADTAKAWYCMENSSDPETCMELDAAGLETEFAAGNEVLSGPHETEADCLAACSPTVVCVEVDCCEVEIPSAWDALLTNNMGCADLNNVRVRMLYDPDELPRWRGETVTACGIITLVLTCEGIGNNWSFAGTINGEAITGTPNVVCGPPFSVAILGVTVPAGDCCPTGGNIDIDITAVEECNPDPGGDCATAPTIEPGVTYGPYTATNFAEHWFHVLHPGGDYSVTIEATDISDAPSDQANTYTGTCEALVLDETFAAIAVTTQCFGGSASGPPPDEEIDIYIRVLASDTGVTYTIRFDAAACPP